MKIKYTTLILLSTLLAGCSDRSLQEPDNMEEDGIQTLVFDVCGAGDLKTRSGRELTSSEATDDVDSVCVAIYSLETDGKIGKRVFTRTLNWKDSVANLMSGQLVHINLRSAPELAATSGLDDGTYTVVATGYSKGHSFVFNPGIDRLDVQHPISKVDMAAGEVGEVFAGGIGKLEVRDRKFVVDESNPVNKTVTLHRQVAGTFGYFKNIPAVGFSGVRATHLRLVASGKNDILLLGAISGSDVTVNMVNGMKTAGQSGDAVFSDGAGGYVVYETALSDWFPNGDVTCDGVLNEKDATYNGMSGNWKVPAGLDDKISVKVGTVFCSSFMVPFLTDGQQTFELQLVSKPEQGTVQILRHWSVTNSEKQQGVNVLLQNGTLSVSDMVETASSYSILRNHLYTIGNKTSSKPDPSNPGDVDDPEDLGKGEFVVISVNDNWEFHNRLVIKPQI